MYRSYGLCHVMSVYIVRKYMGVLCCTRGDHCREICNIMQLVWNFYVGPVLPSLTCQPEGGGLWVRGVVAKHTELAKGLGYGMQVANLPSNSGDMS